MPFRLIPIFFFVIPLPVRKSTPYSYLGIILT